LNTILRVKKGFFYSNFTLISYKINDILKGVMGFDGFAVSDWLDIHTLDSHIRRLHTLDKVAATPKEAVRAVVDMNMVPGDYSFYDLCFEIAKQSFKEATH
jgi:beta-glucosidase